MRCKHADCDRRAHTSGWCTTHYRRVRSGVPMDGPIREYVRRSDPADSSKPTGTRATSLMRRDPFEKELQMLRELGLRLG